MMEQSVKQMANDSAGGDDESKSMDDYHVSS
jgi:hypothetical protein